ncbi:MAG: GH13_20 / GH13 / GH13_36 / GH13_1 / GH13 _2 / GH13_21 / GH13_19 / GH13_23 / GH13_16 / GH13 _26 / GH13_40 / GH13_10 / GH13_30 / GH13_17 / GH13 _31 / GH13_29 / GH13_34 / GH13_4 [uncultured Truepera sp.]|uniref:GH13_20 / GH13 / GH13_36 / GH13_1 / GH13 _2 / GH13_21 / GH13_19 / GH13_23 / GH13_16 / GH13 _26 / GH13_40 / GH13_10 / GH13_30 / GH13_17 / GH13 _31 / GH13_29 / GH13_34 / GH13_4 n=1 Tax=uncultured Truepera sp. TaxID=543023 RepID=A0A6J4VAH1_9DEIN|nr:MAG: GH13_20 / GH13 / GH13_36 / GH13_1 / GH13 _2 / GH13_21 / GH13_19 / GH13_23 / GH13_16 / GH13 _26 / GH13_40 / GH13_10 / GH13_30 / GH13_17 / GH13 _31 / GH13_29 / GH13_34 / GH13_4 [uncultured Truepera sp.]
MNHWPRDAVFYHLYPLGSTGAPERNDFASAPARRLADLHDWLPYLTDLGVNAIFLGPVLESSAHGYDTADFHRVDRRLGRNRDLKEFIAACHARGLRVVLDAVFHHVGRDFWAFRDVRERGEASPYREWFHLDFAGRSPYGDPFSYRGWDGHFDLVKLDTSQREVRAHLLDAAEEWLTEFGADGLRLDAADVLGHDFQRALAHRCRDVKPGCWLLGEVVHGDYRNWAYPDGLDATTNYELYKGLYSSHNDRNYFEVAYALNRQFGAGGIYQDLPLYTFADNHDVPRIASVLRDPAHLYPLHVLLFTVPGVPALYYGSEWGVEGRKIPRSDAPLRPALRPVELQRAGEHPDLYGVVKSLVGLRHRLPALRYGDYSERLVTSEQFVFSRTYQGETVLVAVNSSHEPVTVVVPDLQGSWLDLLGSDSFSSASSKLVLPLDPNWGRVLVRG